MKNVSVIEIYKFVNVYFYFNGVYKFMKKQDYEGLLVKYYFDFFLFIFEC